MNQDYIVTIGAAVADIPLYPVDRSVFDNEICMLEDISMSAGGDALNEATILSRLGYRTRLISLVGNDPAGDFIRKHCNDNGVDTRYLKVKDEVTTSINIPLISPNGDRLFITNKNGSIWKFSLEDIDFTAFRDAKVLSLGSIFVNPRLDKAALIKIFQEAKKRSILICADLIRSRFGEKLNDMKEAFQYIDYLFSNSEEASALTGKTEFNKMADAFLACGVKHVIIKAGSNGAYIATKTEHYSESAYKKAKCVDTTGAGDNFAAGFIASILDGKSLSECGKYANAVASIAIEQIGAVSAVKSKEQVEKRYQEYVNISNIL
jgi:sugar/nucleoside kinase (ribokinase family)